MNFLIYVDIRQMFLGLIPVVVVLMVIALDRYLKFQEDRNKIRNEENVKHWKQVGVNKPRRDFKG
jgi:hypothetical protein